jgi:hypothetical protein
MKKTSKAVADSRKAAGLKSSSFYMTEAERSEIKALAAEMGCSQKDAIVSAVRRYRTQGAMTNEALLDELRSRLK